MRFDLFYICALCAVILVTFFFCFLPQPALSASLSLQPAQLLRHAAAAPSPRAALFISVMGLLYLRVIWQLIHPPRRF